MRTITIVAHAGVVTGLAGLFFGILAWNYQSPYGLPMSIGSLVLLVISSGLGWYYGFSPLWQPRGWQEQVEQENNERLIISTQPYPPYLALKARRNGGAQFGTAVYILPAHNEEVDDDAEALYGMQWRTRRDAAEGHQWVVATLRTGSVAELEEFRVRASDGE